MGLKKIYLKEGLGIKLNNTCFIERLQKITIENS